MNTVRKSFRTRKYLSLQEKENQLFPTPEYMKKRPEIEDLQEEECNQCAGSRRATIGGGRGHQQQAPKVQRRPNRRTSMISTRYFSDNTSANISSTINSSSVSVDGSAGNLGSKRQISRSQSVRLTVIEAVDTLRKKISSTAQLMSQGSLSSISSNINARRRSMRIAANTPPRGCEHRHIKMYSPFDFVTPEKRKTNRKWCDTETPTKLRREVEALTADMQALASLTPNTLRTRAAARRKNSTSPKKSARKLTSSSSIRIESLI